MESRLGGRHLSRTAGWKRLGRKFLDRGRAGHSDLALRGPGGRSASSPAATHEWCGIRGPTLNRRPRRGSRSSRSGEALSGFRFVLSEVRTSVPNIDPGEQDQDYWQLALRLNDASIQRLRSPLRNASPVRGCTQEAQLSTASVDRVISISTVEHIPPGSSRSGPRSARCYCVLVVSASSPSTCSSISHRSRTRRKTSTAETSTMHRIIGASGLTLIRGDTSRLVGIDDCDRSAFSAIGQ